MIWMASTFLVRMLCLLEEFRQTSWSHSWKELFNLLMGAYRNSLSTTCGCFISLVELFSMILFVTLSDSVQTFFFGLVPNSLGLTFAII